MAIAVRTERLTQADDLRLLLQRSEDRLISLSSPADAAELFDWLDQIAELWPEVEASGADLRGEETRWQSLQERLAARGQQVLKAWQGAAGLQKARQTAAPTSDRWWWWLDQVLAERRRRRVRRIGLVAIGLAAVLIVAVLALQRLFPVDPVVRESYRLQTEAEIALAGGDLDAAYAALERAVEVNPQDATLSVTYGALAEVLGQPALAQQMWQRARVLLEGDEARFLRTRSLAYLQAGAPARALEDAQEAVALDPSSAEAHLFLGGALQALGSYQQAVEAFQRAADLADAAGNPQLSVMARTQMANLMQGMQMAPTVTALP